MITRPDGRLQRTSGGRFVLSEVCSRLGLVVTIDDVRAVASKLPRAYEVLVSDRAKFRVGRIVFLAFSRDEQIMGFGFPKEERQALVDSEPDKFLMPGQSDLRYHWVHVRLSAVEHDEMAELVLDAWRMCVPKRVAAEYLASDDTRLPPGLGQNGGDCHGEAGGVRLRGGGGWHRGLRDRKPPERGLRDERAGA